MRSFVGGIEDQVNLGNAELADDLAQPREARLVVQWNARQVDKHAFLTALELQWQGALELCAHDFRVNTGLRGGIGDMRIKLVNGGRLAFYETGLRQHLAKDSRFATPWHAHKNMDGSSSAKLFCTPVGPQSFAGSGDLFAEGQTFHAGQILEDLLRIGG